MTPPPFHPPREFYLVLFCDWHRGYPPGSRWNDWQAYEGPLHVHPDDASRAVLEKIQNGADAVAVMRCGPDGNKDVTESILRKVAHDLAAAADRHDEIPDLLLPYAPEWVIEAREAEYFKDHRKDATE
jgi:hypothetical protein